MPVNKPSATGLPVSAELLGHGFWRAGASGARGGKALNMMPRLNKAGVSLPATFSRSLTARVSTPTNNKMRPDVRAASLLWRHAAANGSGQTPF